MEESSAIPEAFARVPDALWRVGPDAVLVRRVTDHLGEALDLAGGAALVWLALDEPRTVDSLASVLDASPAAVIEAVHMLHDHGLVEKAT